MKVSSINNQSFVLPVRIVGIIFETFDVLVIEPLIFGTRLFVQMPLVVVLGWEAELTNRAPKN